MSDEGAEVERHCSASVGCAEQLSIERGQERQRDPAITPSAAELVRSDRGRRERGGRLRLEEAETLGEFRWNQVAQGYIVDEHQQADFLQRRLPADAHRHV